MSLVHTVAKKWHHLCLCSISEKQSICVVLCQMYTNRVVFDVIDSAFPVVRKTLRTNIKIINAGNI